MDWLTLHIRVNLPVEGEKITVVGVREFKMES